MRRNERPESRLITCSDAFDQDPVRIGIALRHSRSFARIAGQGGGNLPVKFALLFSIENAPHGKNMLHRRFLHVPHPGMNLIDGCCDFGTVFMLPVHRLSKLSIGTAQGKLALAPKPANAGSGGAWEITAEAPGLLGSKSIKWNFTKFLIGRDGQVIKRFASLDKPAALAADIEQALSQA